MFGFTALMHTVQRQDDDTHKDKREFECFTYLLEGLNCNLGQSDNEGEPCWKLSTSFVRSASATPGSSLTQFAQRLVAVHLHRQYSSLLGHLRGPGQLCTPHPGTERVQGDKKGKQAR